MALLESSFAISKKLGRFDGECCQQAFIIFTTVDGYASGIGSLKCWFTPTATCRLSMPLYGSSEGLYISHIITPKLQTSLAGENSFFIRLSGAIHRIGNFVLVWDTYISASFGISRRRPKSPTLQISSSLTMILRAAKSCCDTIILLSIVPHHCWHNITHAYKRLWHITFHSHDQFPAIRLKESNA